MRDLAPRILVVDDDPTMQMLVAHGIRAQRGWRVSTASTAKEAASAIASEAFDLIVLDHQLPDGKGLDLVTLVRERAPETAIIFLTGTGTEALALQALGLGATEYMCKSENVVLTLCARADDVLARAADLATGAKVRSVGPPRVAGPPPAGSPRDLEPEIDAALEAGALGVAVFDKQGKVLSARWPEGTDPAALASVARNAHMTATAAQRLTGHKLRSHVLALEHETGVLCVSTLPNGDQLAVFSDEPIPAACARTRALRQRCG